MNYLLDTHILIWALMNRPELSGKARRLIEDRANRIFYSTVSVWEISIKHQLHPQGIPCSSEDVLRWCEASDFLNLSLQNGHIPMLETLRRKDGAPPHRDPFDRMLMAQAAAENLIFLTHDKLLSFYLGVRIEMV